jgi:hypothetical protein
MNKYAVTWVIDVEANSPEEAAIEARKMQILPTEALRFVTRNIETNKKVRVYLNRLIEV